MEAKDVIAIVVAVALVAIIGFLVIAMLRNFMATGGLIEGFFRDILTSIIEKTKLIINQ